MATQSTPSLPPQQPAQPVKAFSQPLMWLVVGIPAATVVAGLCTLWIAIEHADRPIATDYVKQGMAVSTDSRREQHAVELGVAGTLDMQMTGNDTLQVRLVMTPPAPARLAGTTAATPAPGGAARTGTPAAATPADATSTAAGSAPASAAASTSATASTNATASTSGGTPASAPLPVPQKLRLLHPSDPGNDITLFLLPDGRWWRFQAGRVLGYTLLGAMAGTVGAQLLAAASWQPLFESIWAGMNALLVLLGLCLLVLGREPRWLGMLGSHLASRAPLAPKRRTEWLRGMLWALLPCGLLYTALGTAILAATPLGAAAVMAAFAIGTNLGLFLMEAGARNVLGRVPAQVAYRLNGALLILLAAAGLTAALHGAAHPYC